jgi:hypothetical protein
MFVSVATKCLPLRQDWQRDNPIADAQRSLPDAAQGVFAGIDTDALLGPEDREGGCHLSASGQEKFAAAWMPIIADATKR